MGAAVQFIGKKAVMMAFEKRDAVKWALLCGKSILFAYEGSDDAESRQEFDEWMTMMRGNTTAIYTVRFYDKSVKTIRPATEEVGSFNFRLSEEQEYSGNAHMGAVGNSFMTQMEGFFTKMNARMDEMDKKIAGIPKPEDSDKMETWEKLLDNPIVMAGVAKVFDIDVTGILEQSAKLSGVPGESGDVMETVDGLREHDPKIDAHLQKLLQIAKKKPQQFKTLIGMLDSMPI